MTRHKFWLKLFFLFSAAVLSSCASVPQSRFEAGEDGEALSLSAVAESKPAADTVIDKPAAITEKESRKIHYHGNVELLVTNARATITKVVDVVNARNGYVERITGDTIIVQVPADSFDAAFNEILTFGKVLQKAVTTVDITEEFQSTDLRLKIARTTRDRLLALLKKAVNEEDKLQLLKQIEEITSTIESLESQFEILKTKVNFSKITVQLKTYDQFDSRYRDYEPLGFDWINDLTPLDDAVVRAGDKLAFKEPPGMLNIKNNKRYWSAESGDKTIFRATKRRNEPRGDGEFWLSAINLRLRSKYKSVENFNIGEYKLLRLESFDEVPSIYYVGLKAGNDALKLVELYFPEVKLEDKYKNSIFDSIRSGEL